MLTLEETTILYQDYQDKSYQEVSQASSHINTGWSFETDISYFLLLGLGKTYRHINNQTQNSDSDFFDLKEILRICFLTSDVN